MVDPSAEILVSAKQTLEDKLRQSLDVSECLHFLFSVNWISVITLLNVVISKTDFARCIQKVPTRSNVYLVQRRQRLYSAVASCRASD